MEGYYVLSLFVRCHEAIGYPLCVKDCWTQRSICAFPLQVPNRKGPREGAGGASFPTATRESQSQENLYKRECIGFSQLNLPTKMAAELAMCQGYALQSCSLFFQGAGYAHPGVGPACLQEIRH